MVFAVDFAAAGRPRRPAARGRLIAMAAALSLAGAGSAALAQAQPQVPDLREGVAAVVNNEVISTYDLRQRTLLLIVTSGVQVSEETLPAIQREALRDLIDERLQLQEVRRIEARTKVQLEPTSQELTEQVERLAQQNGLTGQQLVDSLKSAGVDQQTLAGQLLAEIAWQRYVGGRFGGSVKIGDDQIDAAMKRYEAAASKPQYQVAEIFIDAGRAGGQAEAMQGAQQLVQQLQSGAPFSGVARQFSSAPSAAAGGDAGWMISGDMPAAVEQALEQMRPGQVSQPIPVSGGVYILMLRDKREGAGATLVNLKQAAVRLAADASPADVAAAEAKLEALRAKVTSCQSLDAEAAKVDGVVAGDLGEANANDLSESFRDAIAPLQVGQVSAPVRTNAGLHLVALCGRRASSANAPSHDDIENRLTEQELVMIARRELRNLRNSASIETR
jgi:peptidyl-prolyl cis-trans isomerase SurA